MVDVGGPGRPARLVEIVEGRTAAKVSEWLDEQPHPWRAGIRWGVLDMSGPYRKVFDDSLGHVVQVADPFHVVKLRELDARPDAGAGSRTRRSAIEDTRPIRCIGAGGC